MTQTPPIITASRIEAFAASALRVLGWLFWVVLRINPTGRSARLNGLLSRAERGVENILFLKAVVLYGPLPRRKRHPRTTPAGFSRRKNRRRRLFFRNANVRARKAGALTRVCALIYALLSPDRAVAYFFKHICKGLKLAGLAPASPPAQSFAYPLPCAPVAAADTS